MHVDVLKSTVSDNFFYLVHDGTSGTLVDPIDPAVAIRAVEQAGVTLDLVINTHWHPDHVGGNDAVLNHFPDARLCSGPDSEQISSTHAVDRVVADGDTVRVGELVLNVLETPGHTAGHISLLAGDHLFSGDTIFVGGAGNCRFGGDPSVLFRTYRDIIAELPGKTVFYPGHDYSKRNIEFALSLEPELAAAQEMLATVAAQASAPMLTTLQDERRYNPFFRSAESSLRDALKAQHADLWQRERAVSDSDDEATFRTTRELRNSW